MSRERKRIMFSAVPKDRQHHYSRLLKYSKEALAANLAVCFPGPSYTFMESVDAARRAQRAHELNDWLAANQDRARKIISAGVSTRTQILFLQKYVRVRKQFDALIAKIEGTVGMKKNRPS